MLFSFYRQRSKCQQSQRKRATPSLFVERLEDRSVPSTFTVLNFQNGGAGSLRQAILDANANAGADVINFSVAGTIRLTTGALPAITDTVNVDGTTAPSFAGTPLVEVDYNNFAGLRFTPGAAGSALRSLALVNAASAGVTVNGGGNTLVVGNFIGLRLDGATVLANRGNGLELNGSVNNTVGGTTTLDRNVISGNRLNGICITGSSGNKVVGNFLGTDVTGALDRGNVGNGIQVTGGSAENYVGGAPGNVISGNDANGVLINGRATRTTVGSNFIGTAASGNAALGNRYDGVKVTNADNNLIGHADPATGVSYYNAGLVSMPVSGWQGIRGSDTPGQYLMVGTSDSNGLLFEGTMSGVGTNYAVVYPGALNTSVYGPDNLSGNAIRLVGSYKNPDYQTAPVEVNGFLWDGTTADLLNAGGTYQTINYPGAKYNYVHSTMGGLVVGNYDNPADHGSFGLPFGPGHAFIYDIATDTFLTDVVFPGAVSNNAYGIWYNGGTSYTICGGYSLDPVANFDDPERAMGHAYLVDYDSQTGLFSNWASFDYPNGNNIVTHFEGISSVEAGVYTLSADSAQSGTGDPVQGSLVTVRRNSNGSFGSGTWVNLNYLGYDPSTYVTSSDSVYGNQVVGIVIGGGTEFSFQATVGLSNVISGNGGNGVGVYGANDNLIAMNAIGTNAAGTVDLGNAGNGVQVATGSARNVIGGEATGGNDPTNGVFVRPPQGNLISGNNAHGVLVNAQATQNRLSGNFIGTDASGNAALGNTLDGVAIQNANGNSLIGCRFNQNPFVFYNVISGNGGNGLRVTNANDTTIQANFFGIGADNDTAVGNTLNGVVVEGTSSNTLMGGPIPLGNVDAANGQNGLVVRDTASKFVTYNTFTGLAAFSTNPNLGNGRNGMLITSTGGNILIRTCVITRNAENGIEISGAATDVRVAGNIIGLNTEGNAAMGNLGNGVEVGGTAHRIIVGGPQPTFNVIPHNAISANGDNGVAVVGNAYNVWVNFSFIGTDLVGTSAFGNSGAGVLLGPGTHATTVGSTDSSLRTIISGNLGDGIEMDGTRGNTVIGSHVGTDVTGLLPLPNGDNGICISNSFNNVIGRTSSATPGYTDRPANLIAFNGDNGVCVDSGTGNAICENSIQGNTLLGIDLGPGANMNQAAPVLASVQTLPFGVQVSGTLASRPNTSFTIEFFANSANGSSGRFFLGSQVVKTNAAGVAAFTFFEPLPPLGADFITATATDPNGNTSEFSAAVS